MDSACPLAGVRTGWQYGRVAVVAELERRRAAYALGAFPWHVITNVFWTFFVKKPDSRGGPAQSIGYYDDRFVADGDTWRVNWRRVMDASVE